MHLLRPLSVLVTVAARSSPNRTAAPAAHVVTINATDYAFGTPDTIPAGLTTFRMVNAGREPHQAVVAGAPGKTFAELEAALLREGPIPEWLTFPAGPGVVGADYAFATSAPLTAGTHVIRVENSGPQLHELTIERLLPGKTLADWQQWMAGGRRGTPPAEPAGGFVGPDKGKVGWLTIPLKPGNYLLNCYVPDTKDGKPHYVHGMVQQITVN